MKLSAIAIVFCASACGAHSAPAPAAVVEITRSQNPVKLVGEGRLSQPADFIELSMTVHAECFDTPIAASEAADEAVARLMKTLRGHIDAANPKDGVFSHGGFTLPFSRYDGAGRALCAETFQKVTTVVVKTSRGLSTFAGDFARIQRDVMTGALRRPSTPRSEAITYAVVGTPVPQLYYETRERLEQQALADALDNARAKLGAAAKAACGMSDARLLRFEEPSAGGGRPIPYGAASGTANDSGAVALDPIWINKVLDVYFTVEPGTC